MEKLLLEAAKWVGINGVPREQGPTGKQKLIKLHTLSALTHSVFFCISLVVMASHCNYHFFSVVMLIITTSDYSLATVLCHLYCAS